jgi:hypothetical protein
MNEWDNQRTSIKHPGKTREKNSKAFVFRKTLAYRWDNESM